MDEETKDIFRRHAAILAKHPREVMLYAAQWRGEGKRAKGVAPTYAVSLHASQADAKLFAAKESKIEAHINTIAVSLCACAAFTLLKIEDKAVLDYAKGRIFKALQQGGSAGYDKSEPLPDLSSVKQPRYTAVPTKNKWITVPVDSLAADMVAECLKKRLHGALLDEITVEEFNNYPYVLPQSGLPTRSLKDRFDDLHEFRFRLVKPQDSPTP